MVKTGNYTKYLVRNDKIQTNVLECIDINKCLVYDKKVERQNKKGSYLGAGTPYEKRTFYIMI